MASEKNGNEPGWLGAVIPRRRPDASGTNPEPNISSAERKGGLIGLHPAVKVAESFVDRIVSKLSAVEEAVVNTTEAAEKAYLFASVVVDATGAAVFNFPPLMGYDLDIERITSVLPPGGAGVSLSVYMNEVSDGSLVWNGAGLPIRNTLDLGKGIFIPRNNGVTIAAAGLTVGASAYIRMQISRRFVAQGGNIGSV